MYTAMTTVFIHII